MGKAAKIAVAMVAWLAAAGPAGASTCALRGSFVASAALNTPGLTQALVRFEFVPPVPCEDAVPGTVHMVAKLIGRGAGAETARVAPLVVESTGSYVLDADGHLTIQAENLIIEGLVAFVEPAETTAVAGLSSPAATNLNLSKSNVNIFVFTAGDTGNPSLGFSGVAATTVKSSKSNSSE